MKMPRPQLSWLCYLWAIIVLFSEFTCARLQLKNTVKSDVLLSPEFVLKPGSVSNKFYYNIDFPKGHIGIKSFNAEVVDEAGVSVPLHETYLHHWVVGRYYVRKGVDDKKLKSYPKDTNYDFIFARNSGLCRDLGQYFGLGSETRKTDSHVPDPYAIEVGNPAEIPYGYEERWFLNVHAIDTRGVVDKLGCTECRCNLYNVTSDEYGRPLSPDYDGGLYCCYDQTQCKVKEGVANSPRRLYLRYTIKWVDWDSSALPVSIYIFDITDTWTTSQDSGTPIIQHHCKIEYEIERCKSSVVSGNGCIDTKRTSFIMPKGGYLVYGVAHLHSGGTGAALYRQDGKAMCASTASYGLGNKAGNEKGYIVGMSTCYPRPGSIEILDGETVILESSYSSTQKHTGVMGLFYILVADQVPTSQKSFYY